jgi:hypothetical protein
MHLFILVRERWFLRSPQGYLFPADRIVERIPKVLQLVS